MNILPGLFSEDEVVERFRGKPFTGETSRIVRERESMLLSLRSESSSDASESRESRNERERNNHLGNALSRSARTSRGRHGPLISLAEGWLYAAKMLAGALAKALECHIKHRDHEKPDPAGGDHPGKDRRARHRAG
jgi:hypothetical protein